MVMLRYYEFLFVLGMVAFACMFMMIFVVWLDRIFRD